MQFREIILFASSNKKSCFCDGCIASHGESVDGLLVTGYGMAQTIDSPVQAAGKLAEGLGHEGNLQREQAGIKLKKALNDPCAGSVLAITHHWRAC